MYLRVRARVYVLGCAGGRVGGMGMYLPVFSRCSHANPESNESRPLAVRSCTCSFRGLRTEMLALLADATHTVLLTTHEGPLCHSYSYRSLNGSLFSAQAHRLFLFLGPAGVGKTELTKRLIVLDHTRTRTPLLRSQESALCYSYTHSSPPLLCTPKSALGYSYIQPSSSIRSPLCAQAHRLVPVPRPHRRRQDGAH